MQFTKWKHVLPSSDVTLKVLFSIKHLEVKHKHAITHLYAHSLKNSKTRKLKGKHVSDAGKAIYTCYTERND